MRLLAFNILQTLFIAAPLPLMAHFGNTWASVAILLLTFVCLGCLYTIASEHDLEAR